jgi:hypothetical protein
VGVSYATLGGTATSGADYTAVSGTLNFAPGETTKTFTISILDDDYVEQPETVGLTLSNVTGGASLGTGSATLTIVSDDATGTIAATYQQGVNGYTGAQDASITNQSGGATSYTGTYGCAGCPNTPVNWFSGANSMAYAAPQPCSTCSAYVAPPVCTACAAPQLFPTAPASPEAYNAYWRSMSWGVG